MARAIVAPGQRYGRLTVLSRAPDYYSPAGYMQPAWRCRCDCGGQVETLAGRLRSGGVRSCGCLVREHAASKRRDITGLRIGALTAVERLAPGAGRSNVWRWRCDCGAMVDAQPSNLLRTIGKGCRHG